MTGIRIEELLEISHHSPIQYRLLTSGEVVPLLQIAPSKSDAERLLVVSAELADILSTIFLRIRDTTGKVTPVPAYGARLLEPRQVIAALLPCLNERPQDRCQMFGRANLDLLRKPWPH